MDTTYKINPLTINQMPVETAPNSPMGANHSKTQHPIIFRMLNTIIKINPTFPIILLAVKDITANTVKNALILSPYYFDVFSPIPATLSGELLRQLCKAGT